MGEEKIVYIEEQFTQMPRKVSFNAFMHARHLALFAYPVLLVSLLFSPKVLAQQKGEFDCRASVKYECTADQCERVMEDFQHEESFLYNAKTGELSACLWTNCYSAKTKAFTVKAGGAITAIGRLVPAVHPKNKPLVVSLTIKASEIERGADEKKAPFTAIWDYGGDRLTFDMGECVLKPPAKESKG
ncbi:MAG: hypothetical protein ABS69_02655 [Nitrosomonadales bacterium SCN 54-20]|nr:MAG: hypothetical protein ABS69_02655 [Nitrosomonadales bacterium SCN 54-20]